ncbi:MAG: aspartate aminotransferase family protein [Thiothrix sp.]|nr:MAG: aspartate aminotransferase family protein [Thiothrix sp.]
MESALMQTYSRLPVSFTHGEGVWLWDSNGKRYLDALSGIAVCGLGHAHPRLTETLAKQAGRLLHTSNVYGIESQEKLGSHLRDVSGMDKVFFCNSGAEANEAAIKLARLYGHQQNFDKPKIIVMEGSFHGRTLATLSATGNTKVRAGFEPLVEGFVRVLYNDIEAVKQAFTEHQDITAILVEPILGEGGINIPDAEYLPTLRALCNEHSALLMLDEIQTGTGRTGEWFAFQHFDFYPDVMTLAKGLGNGIPIGACLAKGQAARVFAPGNHGSTFGGNPFACTAAETVLTVIEDDGLLKNAAEKGRYLLDGFKKTLGSTPNVTNIRASGLMIGIELNKPCGKLIQQALDQQLLINVTAEKVIRLLPPLILSTEQADIIIEKVSQLIFDHARGE